jgi:carboxyl-terminal processing protease
MKRRYEITAIAALMVCALFTVPALRAQQQQTLTKVQQYQITDMLQAAYNEVKSNYYDPQLQGLDWKARYKKYSAMIDNAHNLGEGFRIVAAFLSGLKDTHTFFDPPGRAASFDTGYRFALVGDAWFITQVRPKSDAEAKMHIGDQVVTVDGFNANRNDFNDLQYFLNALAPQASTQFDLRSPAGEERQVVVNSAVKPHMRVLDLRTHGQDYNDLVRQEENEEHATRSRVIEKGDAAIWKLQQFDVDIREVEKEISIARKHKTLILDLRGNPGGYTDSLQWIVGSLFDHDVKIADRVGRKEHKPQIGKHHGDPFDGKLIVLVDGGSASSSELLARVIQIEHRGTVIGDRTAGAVMEAKHYSEESGDDVRVFYGISVTDANLIMTDGKSLEKTGVVPDELLLPTGADLAAGRDPVLVRAAELAGVKLDPVEAGKMFPFEWVPIL